MQLENTLKNLSQGSNNVKILSIEFELFIDSNINQHIDFNKKINGNFDYENFGNLTLQNLFVLDNKNNLICSPNDNKILFENFCNKYDLNYIYNDFNNNYLESYFDTTIKEINPANNSIKFITTITTKNIFPKSQKLDLYFNQLTLTPKDQTENTITLSSDCNISLDVPSIIQNRTNNNYKVISCSNESFELYEAKLTETNFEIGITIKNTERPIYPKELEKIENDYYTLTGEFKNLFFTEKDILEFYGPYGKTLYEDYYKNLYPINRSR